MKIDTLSSITLDHLAVGRQALISEIRGDRQMARRLMSLGIRVGSEIQVTQQRDRGVVVACAGNRVALGGSVASKLFAQPLVPADTAQ